LKLIFIHAWELNWLVCRNVFGIRSQFISLHVLQIWNTLIHVNFIISWIVEWRTLKTGSCLFDVFFLRNKLLVFWKMSSLPIIRWLKFGYWILTFWHLYHGSSWSSFGKLFCLVCLLW
jgi:hypothetical protein